MRNRKEVKFDLLNALENIADAALVEVGFKRRKNSLSYARSFGDVRQILSFDAVMSPEYQPDAEVHIYPSVRVSIKSVGKVALDLVHGNKVLLANSPDIVLSQPIELVAPKSARVLWFASGPSDIDRRVGEIVHFAEEWVLPLLNDLRTPDDLVKIYEADDPRVMKQQHWFIFIAAADVVLGKSKEALAVLEGAFSASGLRKRYAAAFESLTSKVHEGN